MANLAIVEKMESIAANPKTRFMNALAQALPKGSLILPAALVRQAIVIVKGSDALQRASEFSLFNSIAEVAQIGLSLDLHLGQAFLVPFSGTCTVMYGYRGLTELARRSGEIADVVGEIRYAKDHFKLRLGTTRDIEHIPLDKPLSQRGPMLGAYAVADFFRGARMFEYMDAEEIEGIKKAVLARKRSEKKSPWETNESEMWRKTPIRRLAKRMPQSPSLVPFVQAAVRDEYRQAGEVAALEVTPEITAALDAVGITPQPEDVHPQPEEHRSEIKEKRPKADAVISKDQARNAYSMMAELKLEGPDLRAALTKIGHKDKLEKLPESLFPKLLDELKKISEK